MADVQTEIGTEQTAVSDVGCQNGTAAYNATCGGLEGVETFGSWLDTIALIIVAAVVIGIIVSSFGRAGR